MANSPTVTVTYKGGEYQVKFMREPDWIAYIYPTPLHTEDSHSIVELAQNELSKI